MDLPDSEIEPASSALQVNSLPTELSRNPTLQTDFFKKERRKEGREGGKREKVEGRETRLCWGRVSAFAPLDSVPTILLTVFCQLWCWNPAETADVPEADGQRPSGPPQ